MLKKFIIAGVILSFFIVLISSPLIVSAQTASDSIIDPTTAAYKTGNYSLNDILGLAVNASRWILGIVGSLALLMFIYGGFTFLISAGSSEKISEARKIILAAVIGLIIVFSSYLIIQFVLNSLGLNWSGDTTKMGQTADNRCEKTWGNQGYSCQTKTSNLICISGLCPGEASNQCCKAK